MDLHMFVVEVNINVNYLRLHKWCTSPDRQRHGKVVYQGKYEVDKTGFINVRWRGKQKCEVFKNEKKMYITW